MNYRAIFNPDYNFIGLILIALLITIILLLHRNIKYSLKIISKTFLITGIITFIIAIFLNITINMVLDYQYRIFIQVISKNVIRTVIYDSIICMGFGGIGYLFLKNFSKEKHSLK